MFSQKLVHLDLKGAPPRADYLVKLMPWFRKWGATGLLIEWEDMLPYSGPFRKLRSRNAYTPAELSAILSAAQRSRLEVVPLVQTFGHLEFVLKHPAFQRLRENAAEQTDLCPSHPEAAALIIALVDQVLSLNPGIRSIHLGGDEVRSLGSCRRCKPVATRKGKAALYLRHIRPVLDHVRSRGVTPLLWDDMFRSWSVSELRALAPLAEVVPWFYTADISQSWTPELRERYVKAGLTLWAATAFKGAGGQDIQWVDSHDRVANHVAWAAAARKTRFKGAILTGWSRYHHNMPLCETLPAGLPALALCLKILQSGGYSEDLRRRTFQALGLGDMPLMHLSVQAIASIPKGRFPGARAFSAFGVLRGYILLLNQARACTGKFPEQNGGRIDPHAFSTAARVVSQAQRLGQRATRQLQHTLKGILYAPDVRELIGVQIKPQQAESQAIRRRARQLLAQVKPGF